MSPRMTRGPPVPPPSTAIRTSHWDWSGSTRLASGGREPIKFMVSSSHIKNWADAALRVVPTRWHVNKMRNPARAPGFLQIELFESVPGPRHMRAMQRALVRFFCGVVVLPHALLFDRLDLVVRHQPMELVHIALNAERIALRERRRGISLICKASLHDGLHLVCESPQ